jgi:hypothetical protein
VNISDWLVIAPWLAFAAGLVVFFVWLRRPSAPPSGGVRIPQRFLEQQDPSADARAPGEQATDSSHHETTTS